MRPTTMGQFIDGLTDEERDRLVTAHDFNDGHLWWNVTLKGGCGCLVGTVHYKAGTLLKTRAYAEHMDAPDCSTLEVPWHEAPASIRYPQAVYRFGKARVVRAVKLRAARGNHIALPDMQTAPETATTHA